MPTDIVMPQMGESIVEGTITKWLKKPGDKVQRDEPLFEISTDKVDAEIPAPASGILQEIKVTEGTTVGVNTVVGTIAADGEAARAPEKTPAPAPAAEKSASLKPAAPEKRDEKKPGAPPDLRPFPPFAKKKRKPAPPRSCAKSPAITASVSPKSSGTGLGGRITKQDIMSFIERQSSQPARGAADALVRPAERSEASSPSGLAEPAAPRPSPLPPPSPATSFP